MSDEQPKPDILPLAITQVTVRLIERFPERTFFHPAVLKNPHLLNLTVDGDMVTVGAHNGTAKYRLLRDEPHDQGVVAELVEGPTPGQLKAKARKYEVTP